MSEEKRLFTSESVTEGHPDKIADQISDAILDAVLEQDPYARVAVETIVNTGLVVVFGEMSTTAYVDIQKVVRDKVKEIGYTRGKYGFDADNLAVMNTIDEQSPDIAQGVNNAYDDSDEIGAGDQGLMFGYATNETPELMPLPIMLAHKLTQKLAEVRKNNTLEYLRPDGKAQVTIEYDEQDKPIRIDTIVVSSQHAPEIELDQLREDIKQHVILEALPSDLIDEDTRYLINPTGRFVIGGPHGDSGLCLAEGTLVNTIDRGLIPVEDLKEGNSVTTESGKATIIKHYNNGVKDTLIIEDSDGHIIESTLNHPFRVLDDNEEIVWREAGDLKEGDYLLRKKDQYLVRNEKKLRKIKYKGGELKVDKGFAYLMGWLIGDGNTTATKEDRLTFYYNHLSEEEKNHVKERVTGVFGSDKVKHYDCQNDRYLVLSTYIYKELIRQGYIIRETARNKYIPRSILTLNDSLKAEFLSGLFDSDGHISLSGRNNNTYEIKLTTSSKKLSQDVSTLLMSMGIITSIFTRVGPIKGGVKDGIQIVSEGDMYDVIVQGNASKRLFLQNVGFRLPRKKSVYEGNSFLTDKSVDIRLNDHMKYPLQNTVRALLQTNPGKKGRWFSGVGRPSRKHAYTKTQIHHILDMYDDNADNEDYLKLKWLIDNDIQILKVKKIEPSQAHTYDITLDDDTHAFVANGFIVHNTGRKIIVDTYGGSARHGGGAYSSKDATKVDRSASYMARYIAKNIVAANLADKCEVQLAYAIGVAEPVSIRVDTFGTGKYSESDLVKAVRKVFKTTPGGIIDQLDLRRPIYAKTAAYGHFGRELPEFVWERKDKVNDLKQALSNLNK